MTTSPHNPSPKVQPWHRDRAAVVYVRQSTPQQVLDHRESTARQVAQTVGINEVIAGVLPAGKLDAIRAEQTKGRKVAMVGDGINDAPALAGADLGIAMGGGTDVALEAADVTVLRSDVESIPDALQLARRTYRVIVQNLVWAFGYNVVLIPVAAGLLYPVAGLMLSPALAAAAMALSSVSVVMNSLRLRRFSAA